MVRLFLPNQHWTILSFPECFKASSLWKIYKCLARMYISCLAHPSNKLMNLICFNWVHLCLCGILPFLRIQNYFFIPSDSDTVLYSLHFEINKQTNKYNVYTVFPGPLPAFQNVSGILVKFPGTNYRCLEYNSFEVT